MLCRVHGARRENGTWSQFARWATRPGGAFALGWSAPTALAVALWIADSASRPAGGDGLHGLGAALDFLMFLFAAIVVGPAIGILCATAVWLWRRRMAA
jgi:hypothetical protein